jgi:signal transduction histidine kinase
MTGQAEAWSIDDPGRRFGDTQRFAELATLAHTLDALLDRVAAVLRHERALTGDLSHELRTPLARIKAETELVVGVDGKADEQAIAGIRESTARMERIIDALLTSARTEHAADQGRCAVGQAIGAALEACHRDDVEVTVVTTPPDLHAGVDFAVCERIIAPLVDNGARFAKDRLAIHAHASDGRVHIDVTNDGPPLPDALGESIFRPGTHAPDPSGHDGAGLGLALARRLARAADGDVLLSELDPVTFRIDLPS